MLDLRCQTISFLLLFLVAPLIENGWAWNVNHPHISRSRMADTKLLMQLHSETDTECHFTRRSLLKASSTLATLAWLGSPPSAAAAAISTETAQVTDRIFVEVKGLGPDSKRINISLFGRDAPRCTKMLKQLISRDGLPAPCKPKAERALQKEQLEANKVYNRCLESQEKGVNYDYSTIWRIIPDQRIDVGAVSGRFIAREYPNWTEDSPVQLRHDSPGVVSVRKGNDSGFGFTIFSGGDSEAAAELDRDHIVVGKVENLDVIRELNQVPVITTSKQANYMALTGGPSSKSAPSRACTYGGAMYCNEFKPLIKLSISSTGKL